MKAVQWGCRISCSTHKCERHAEVWSDLGCPPLPFAGAPTSGPLKGWFLRYDGSQPPLYQKGHVAFCPEHSEAAVAFLAEHNAYSIARSKVGRDTALTLLDKIAQFLSPRLERKQYVCYEAVRAWDKEHPAPRLPWVTK